MVLRAVVLDLWAAGVLLSLASIAFFSLSWAAVCVLTLARARRQLRRAKSRGSLPGMSPDFAEVDEALERILRQERGVLPSGLLE